MMPSQGWLFGEPVPPFDCGGSAEAWRAQAFELLVRYAKLHDRFLIEDVRAWPEAVNLPPPHDNRAWGSVAMRALREGVVTCEGLRHDRYASQKHVWRSLVVGQL